MALRTPLYPWHARAGARLIEFGGWEMPLQYSGIVDEHLTVRRSVGLFDVSHMGKLLVYGSKAQPFLDGLSANDIPATPGRARYTQLLREDGTIIDDVIVTCLTAARYFVVCNAGTRPMVLAWLAAHQPRDVRIDDLTMTHLCVAVQGPQSLTLLQRLTSVDLTAIRPFWGSVLDIRDSDRAGAGALGPLETEGWGWPREDPLMATSGSPTPTPASAGRGVFATRTGYTGEMGFELFPPAAPGLRLWDALMKRGQNLGLKPVGLGARDTLRLEKGYLLSGQDFTGSQTPLEVDSEWVVKWKRTFLGRDALESQKAAGNFSRLVGLRITDRGIPRHGCPVRSSGLTVGTVTSGTLSPSLRVGIALASVDSAHASVGTNLEVEIRGLPHPAQVVRLPFL